MLQDLQNDRVNASAFSHPPHAGTLYYFVIWEHNTVVVHNNNSFTEPLVKGDRCTEFSSEYAFIFLDRWENIISYKSKTGIMLLIALQTMDRYMAAVSP